jgi:23S rRNA (pseudouridine1915-N3)-methyltransferase
MKIRVAWIQARPGKDKLRATQSLTAEYLERLARYVPVETHEVAAEAALLALIEKSKTSPFLILLDSRGKQVSSEELASFLEKHQSQGTQQLLFAVGGADGFSSEIRKRAQLELSLGKMTFPHELARVILLEQLYRAFTILKGHPYHTGH